MTKGADGKCRSAGKKVDIQTQWIGGEGINFAPRWPTSRRRPASSSTSRVSALSHETVLKTRIDGGKPPDLAMLAQPTPVLAYAKAGKLNDVATFMDPASSRAELPASISLVSTGRQHLGHPL